MVPTMMILRMQLGTGADPATAAFWFVMSMALLAGAIVAYPMNWWRVSYHLKHGMITVRQAAVSPVAAAPARAIEFTRFPSPHEPDEKNNEEGLLVRSADLIGQLGDPHYLRKAYALYVEFEEVGMNRQLGYTSPADLTDLYPQFYWNSVSAHIQNAIRYLNVTSSGRQWISSLYSNFFRAERDVNLSGPQR